MLVVESSFLEDQYTFLNIVGVVVHRVWMLNYNAASSTYSYVAFWFDPYYAITISKPGIKHEPSDVSDDGILLSLHEHIISNKTGHPARSKDSIEVACEMTNQSEKLAIVLEQVRIVERRVIVGWARHH